MSRTGNPGFRTTVWPGSPVPVPPVTMWKVGLVTNAVRYVRPTEEKPLAPEVVLRMVPRMADDTTTLLQFMAEHGPLTCYPGPDSQRLLPSHYKEEVAKPVIGEVPVAVVRRHLHVVQTLVAHWEAHQSGDDNGIIAAWGTTIAWFPVESVHQAWGLFADHVNAALTPFHVGIQVEGTQTMQPSFVSAYSAMVLSIVNDIALQTPWRRCANEPCGNLFARQIGRAEQGQNRTMGVIYCSRSCAKAQVERERRRRQKAGGSANGT